MKRLVPFVTVLLVALSMPAAAAAHPFPGDIVLSGATSAEGIAIGEGSTFYAGDAFRGDIYRGDLRTGSNALFIDAPTGRNALGMKVDLRHHLLFVAGGFTGQGYVYDTRTGADVATFQFADPTAGPTVINDVIVARGAAWFTDSGQPHLYRVPIASDGSIGSASTLTVSGPAADLSGAFNLNGIAATPDGKTLVVAHSGDATVYTVDPQTGDSARILEAGTQHEVDLPNIDGILLEAGRLWAVQNFSNQVTELRLSPDLSSASVLKVITSKLFEVPTTAARHGNRLAIVNAKFDTGLPPTAPTYDVVVIDGR